MLSFSGLPGSTVLIERGQEWYNLGRNSEVRNLLEGDADFPSPYHHDRPSPLRNIEPSGNDPRLILVDLAHCYAIKGWGKEDLASSIVFLTVRCGIFGWGGDFKEKLDRAWMSFKGWCVASNKTTQLMDFSIKCLKINSRLVPGPSLACFS